MPPPTKRNLATLKTAAFTLIETVLALGIVAVTLVPMMGLLPVGLSTHRDTIDRTTSARITQQISGEFFTGSSSIPAQQTRYFDFLAQETYDAAAAETIYIANIVATPAIKLPGDETTGRTLTCVTVEVCGNPNHGLLVLGTNNFIVKKEGQQVREYTFNVSR